MATKTRHTKWVNGALEAQATDIWGESIHSSHFTAGERAGMDNWAHFHQLHGRNIADWQYWRPVTGLATSDYSQREGRCIYIRRQTAKHPSGDPNKGKFRIACILAGESYLFPGLDEFTRDPGFDNPAETPREIFKELQGEDEAAVSGYAGGDRGDRAFDAAEKAKKLKRAADRQAARAANEAALEGKILASRRAAYERAGLPFPEGSQPAKVKRTFIDKSGKD